MIHSGEERLILSATVDITGRKMMEEALRESESRFMRLFESAPIPLAFASNIDDYRATTWNEAWYRTFGYTPQQADGRSGAEFGLWLKMDDRKRFLDTVKVQSKVAGMEVAMRRSDGAPRICEIFGRFIGNTDHQLLMAAYVDITESKQAQLALKESEERFSKAFHSSPAPMCISDIDVDRLFDVNEKLLQMLELTRAEAIGSTSCDIGIWHDPEARLRLGKKLRAGGSLQNEKVQLVTKTGKIRDTFWSAEIVNIAGAEAMLSLLYDSTDRKKAQEEQEKLQAQLQQAQKMESVGRLAGGVAHDYNNMLGVIIGHAELASLKMDAGHEIQRHIKEIMNAAQRSSELTQQLLAFARRQTIAPRILDLNAAVADTLQMVQVLVGEGIDLFWLPGSGIFTVKIDPVQLNQLLMNLCVNARDAITGEGRITIETEESNIDQSYCAATPYFVPGRYAVLVVSDNGCGMNKEIQAKIFEPFYTTKGAGKGTGLGLATVYGIVKQNNGFVTVYSEPGKGASFRIYLPLHDVVTVKAGASTAPRAPQCLGETVLVVEDEKILLDTTTTMLADIGYTTLAAGSPVEALRMVQEHADAIDLLVTDVVMPDMNGRELVQQIRKISPAIKCLFMSGYTANVISQYEVFDKAVHFIQKPFNIKDLATKVRAALEQEPRG